MNGLVTIPLSKGKHAVVDVVDAHFAEEKWCVNNYGYAVRTDRLDGKQVTRLMHREIIGAEPGSIVDHVNGDKLDNRRANLRIATHADNMRNSTIKPNRAGYRGVKELPSGNFAARIKYNKENIHIGTFPTAIEAALAYNEKAIEVFGEFAKINIINEV